METTNEKIKKKRKTVIIVDRKNKNLLTENRGNDDHLIWGKRDRTITCGVTTSGMLRRKGLYRFMRIHTLFSSIPVDGSNVQLNFVCREETKNNKTEYKYNFYVFNYKNFIFRREKRKTIFFIIIVVIIICNYHHRR